MDIKKILKAGAVTTLAAGALLVADVTKVEDVAQGILYLASDAAPTVTGAQLLMDNGMLSH